MLYPIELRPARLLLARVKTGQRRLIEFFLSPLLKYSQESFHEG